MHLKNVLFLGALCCAPVPDPDSLTFRPEQVTCEECLVRMGRRAPLHVEDARGFAQIG